ncbi:potassium channel family protein [Streptomyces sp. NPDC058685]|uniref:potassium channel family protein n=1 Tax=Streptomyces sp. NPDC058685 TaxID=3346598 RepID=UPI00365427C9
MTDESPVERWQRRIEIPMLAASALFLASFTVRVLAENLPAGWYALCEAVTFASWALFIVDYAVRWRLSGEGLAFVRRHVMDAIVVVLPLLRPLRIVKIYEAVQRRHAHARLPLQARVIAYAGLSTLLLGFAGALSVYHDERNAPGATIKTFGDAIWWTSSTVTTVGYGDMTPVTPRGRVVAVGMMVGGVALLGAVTGSFSSWLLQTFAQDEEKKAEETKPPGGTPGASDGLRP